MFFRPGTVRIPFALHARARERLRVIQRIELDPARDRHARAALEAYADACAAEMPWLAEWLDDLHGKPAPALTRCAPTVLRVFDLAQAWAADQPDYARGAWEHVRGQLLAALAGHEPAGEAPAGSPAARVAECAAPGVGEGEHGQRDADAAAATPASGSRPA